MSSEEAIGVSSTEASGGDGSAGAVTEQERDVLLRLAGISKRFGPVQANDDVTFEVLAGEIHALLGENGSGKSTLLGIASGMVAADAGTVEIGGSLLATPSPAAAMAMGLGMAYQTMSEVVGLTVAENLYLAAPAGRRPAYGRMNVWAQAYVDSFGLEIAASSSAATLSPAKRQLLEVAQALLAEPRVLLLDEPTTALGHADVQRLHRLILQLKGEGLGIVYVSHRLPEVLEVADRITVLRDGVSQGTYEAPGVTETDVVNLMIGRPLEHAFPEHGASLEDADHLSISGLTGRRFGPVDLEVSSGEILGIAGTEGNGQAELLRALAGVEPSHGSVKLSGRSVAVGSPVAALQAGIVLLSADRKAESVLVALGVRANATLQVLSRFGRVGYVRRSRERGPVHDLVRRLRLKAASIEQPVGYLSGGNQQKVALMRPFLKEELRVVLADEPTQGVDVGARLDIYRALRERADEGAAILVKSGDAIELAGLCDRVVVMSRGRIVDTVDGIELTEARIIGSIIGKSSAHDVTAAPGSEDVVVHASADSVDSREAVVVNERRVASRRAAGRWLPIAAMLGLIVALGWYTGARNDAFLSSFNLNGLLVATLPMACVAMGQTSALMVKAFDVSVGALMGIAVVTASFVLDPSYGWPRLLLGALIVLGVAIGVACVNVVLIRFVGLSSIIATLATMSALSGAALWLRPQPAGIVSSTFRDFVLAGVGFVPYAFILVVVVAFAADFWLYRTVGGLAARAAGLDEVAAARRGVRVSYLFTRAFFIVAVAAAFGGFFLAAQVGIGDPNVGISFTLTSIAAAVLGGASLLGGRGSFVGAVVGAVFLNMVVNVLPYLGWSSSYGRIMIGAFTLVALALYQAPEFASRVRQAVANTRVARGKSAVGA